MSRSADKSRFLSLVLRHEPEAAGVTLDSAGWVDVDTLLKGMAAAGRPTSRAELEMLVKNSDKQRFALSADGQRIRANQGHSVGVDLELSTATPPETLYHGTVERFLPSIEAQGLLRGERHHVHLSSDRHTAFKVGNRRGQAVLLEVASGAMAREGHQFFLSANGVWLTEAVPPVFVRRLPDQE